MRYQVYETPIFLGIFDQTKIQRDNCELMGFMPYWIIALQTWDETQYRQVYELCSSLNRYEKHELGMIGFKMSLHSAANHLNKAISILNGGAVENPRIG